MNCINHPDAPVAAYCRTCGKALCATCQRLSQGAVFCDEHVPAAAPANSAPPPVFTTPPQPSQTTGASPGLAFVLGFIPGVGAIYNGQYAKGLVHVLVFGLLVSILSSGAAHGLEPLVGIFLAAWFFYMAFEAFHTASRRQRGVPVDEFSSLFPLRHRRGFPVGPVILIGLGVLFLLNTMDILSFEKIVRFWPVFLIVLGLYMLYCRLAGDSAADGSEVSHDRR